MWFGMLVEYGWCLAGEASENLGCRDASALECWLGNEACGLVSLMIVNDALLGKHHLGCRHTSALVCWLGNEACGLVSLTILDDVLVRKHKSMWFGMLGGQ